MSKPLPSNVSSAIRKVASEYLKSFDAGDEVPVPQVIALKTVEAIKTATTIKSVK